VTLNYTSLFDRSLFKFDLSNIPPVLQLYKDLTLPPQPLTLVPPEFEVPQPPFQLAVYPPQLRDPPKPALELFNLEDEFASERESLATLTNKCLYFFPLHALISVPSPTPLSFPFLLRLLVP
jgi:intraflagellar transport protein 52